MTDSKNDQGKTMKVTTTCVKNFPTKANGPCGLHCQPKFKFKPNYLSKWIARWRYPLYSPPKSWSYYLKRGSLGEWEEGGPTPLILKIISSICTENPSKILVKKSNFFLVNKKEKKNISLYILLEA